MFLVFASFLRDFKFSKGIAKLYESVTLRLTLLSKQLLHYQNSTLPLFAFTFQVIVSSFLLCISSSSASLNPIVIEDTLLWAVQVNNF